MPTIIIITHIKAPAKRCFDLSTSIDLHIVSTKHTGESAIAGRTSGLIKLNETVTWRAKHLGIWQTVTSRITELQYYSYFVDEMVDGAFKSFRHEHHFHEENGATIMKDVFNFESPFGLAGEIFNLLFLKGYMTRLLETRNMAIKKYAESDEWPKFIPPYVI